MKLIDIRTSATKLLIHRDFSYLYFANGPTLRTVYQIGYSSGGSPEPRGIARKLFLLPPRGRPSDPNTNRGTKLPASAHLSLTSSV